MKNVRVEKKGGIGKKRERGFKGSRYHCGSVIKQFHYTKDNGIVFGCRMSKGTTNLIEKEKGNEKKNFSDIFYDSVV